MAILKYYNTATSAWEYIAASTTANFTSWKKTMSGGETSVSGTDDNAVTLSYTVGLEQVFINGVLQVRGTDYTATDGTSVTGLSALVASDIVTVVCYAPFNVANTIAPTVIDAKGDLLAGTAADTVGRLAVGTDGQLLAADSGETTGLKWTTPASGGLTLLSATTFSAVASHSVNDVFSATYTKYKLLIDFTNSTGNSFNLRLRVGGSDLATDYNFQTFEPNNTDVTSGAGRTTSTTEFSLGNIGTNVNMFEILVGQPQQTARTTIMSQGQLSQNTIMFRITSGITSVTTSYTGFTIFPGSGTMTGSISVYGYNE